jgi:CRISPR-associated protein Cas1
LSPVALGITGVLDVIEEKNGEQCPVETKHGPPPHDENGNPTVWDPAFAPKAKQGVLHRSPSWPN